MDGEFREFSALGLRLRCGNRGVSFAKHRGAAQTQEGHRGRTKIRMLLSRILRRKVPPTSVSPL
jgi:hypothetical protein